MGKKEADDRLEAKAVLGRGAENWLWIVPECPICGCKHQHGGGKVEGGDPISYLGGREAHCWKGPGGDYVLVDSRPEDTKKILSAQKFIDENPEVKAFLKREEARNKASKKKLLH